MNKKVLSLASLGILSAFLTAATVSPHIRKNDQAASQDQEKSKGKRSGTRSGVLGGVIGGIAEGTQGEGQGKPLGGVLGGTLKAAFDDDFLLEPRKIVQFKIEHLLIRPSDTILLPEITDLKTEIGFTVNYAYRLQPISESIVDIELTPFIVDEKGIDLMLVITGGGRIIKEQKIQLRNLEPVVVEIMENKADGLKLADRITPLIQNFSPLQSYPGAVGKIEMLNDVLIMNDTMVINGTRGKYLACDGGSESTPFYLFFWIKGKGIYVLSLWPFEGAEPVGVVSSNTIRIREGRDFFTWFSMKPILPEGKWRVWVRNNPSFDPVLDFHADDPPAVQKEMKEYYEKENSAFAGVTQSRGRDGYKKFFGKK